MTRYSGHTISARALAGDAIVPLSVERAYLTLDESWMPYASGTLVCKIPADPTLIDPRADARVSLVLADQRGTGGTLAEFDAAWTGTTLAQLDAAWTGTTLADLDTATGFEPWAVGDTVGSTLVLNLGIRARRIDHLAKTMTLELASDEALIEDLANLSPSMTAGSTSVRGACNMVLGQIGAVLATGTADATVAEADALVWETGETGATFLSPLLQLGNLRLWCDEARTWRLDSRDMQLPAVTVLHDFEGVEDTISRDGDWYDAVCIEYTWTNTSGSTSIRRDVAGRSGASRVLLIQHDRPWPGAGAAARLLDRVRRRGRVLSLTGVSDYTARPSNELTAIPPGGAAVVGTVEAVSFTWPEATMTVRSRGLVDTSPAAWVLLPSGQSWTSYPAGVSWLNAPIGA